jgi:hypothetical protein
MNRISRASALAITALFLQPARAQEPPSTPPPKVLVITREFLKPGKTGAAHEKAESLYIEALNRAKSSVRYIGAESLSGKPRALFFSGYPSLAAWQEAEAAERSDPALAAAIARAALADGELLESTDRSVWLFDADNSLQPAFDLARVRYFEIEIFYVRPGHNEWLEISTFLKAAYSKSMPNHRYALYSNLYGQPEGSMLVITPLESAAEIDAFMAAASKFLEAAGGEAGLKHIFDLEAASVSSSEMNLLKINPRLSRLPASLLQSGPPSGPPKPTQPPSPKP